MSQTAPLAAPARMPGLERLGIALLWLAAAAAAVLAPEPAERPVARSAPTLERWLEPVAAGKGLVLAGERDVWWVTRDAAVRFADGEPAHGERVVDLGERARALGRAEGFSAAHLDASRRLWLGTGHGEVSVRDADGRWLASFPAHDARGRVRAISTQGDEVYVAADGLWQGSLDGDGLHPVEGFASRRIERVTADAAHGLAIASRRRVWRREGEGWRSVWRAASTGDVVTALAFSRAGELWIGTADGLVRLGRDGSEQRELAGARVETLSESRAGVAYAGTRDAGLFARYAGGWRRVGAAGSRELRRVSGIAPAPQGALWLALGEQGLFRAGS